MLGLVTGQSGARRWRRVLSDPAQIAKGVEVLYDAWRALNAGGRQAADSLDDEQVESESLGDERYPAETATAQAAESVGQSRM